jgi:hypothetical protein
MEHLLCAIQIFTIPAAIDHFVVSNYENEHILILNVFIDKKKKVSAQLVEKD